MNTIVASSPSIIRATAIDVARAKALAPRPVAPVHVKRWTGRAALTLPLPTLAARWLGRSSESSETSAGLRA